MRLLYSIISLCCFLGFTNLFAQNLEFKLMLPPPPVPQISVDIKPVIVSSTAVADVDGDSDLDIVICGEGLVPGDVTTTLYLNDGNGNFNGKPNANFDNVAYGSIVFADIDGDQDQDLVVSGLDNAGLSVTSLYVNNGSGTFTKVNNTPFTPVGYSALAFGDIDGDNDPDLILTGYDDNFSAITELYQNDGSGNFTLLTNSNFQPVGLSAVLFVDLDNDSDLDLIIAGNGNTGTTTKAYLNNGVGLFTEDTRQSLLRAELPSIAASDVDNDNDLDILVAGSSGLNGTTTLYLNDGNGLLSPNFSGLLDVSNAAAAFSDIDGDADEDLIITGSNNTRQSQTKLYTNDGLGNFTEVLNQTLTTVADGTVNFADFNSDNQPDIFLTGYINEDSAAAKIYINNGNQNFLEAKGSKFESLDYSSASFADVDGDNDLDLLLAGSFQFFKPKTKLYLNDGLGNYSESSHSFDGVDKSTSAIADVDQDGDIDILISGNDTNGNDVTKYYRNHGSNVFIEATGALFSNSNILASFVDINGDSVPDLFTSETNGSGQKTYELRLNNGSGSFSPYPNISLNGIAKSPYQIAKEMRFLDIDLDGDQDLVITAINSSSTLELRLYRNDGSNNYTIENSLPLSNFNAINFAFADIDGDQDPDFFANIYLGANQPATHIFKNDGLGNFSPFTNSSIQGFNFPEIVFEDIDLDTDLDLLISGNLNNLGSELKVYLNDGSGLFNEEPGLPFDGVTNGAIAIGDIDGDSDKDIFVTGHESANLYTDVPISKMYRNGQFSHISIAEENLQWKIDIFPNPTQGNVTLNFIEEQPLIDLTVTDVSGRVVQKETFRNISTTTVKIPYQKGVYFISVKKPNMLSTFKILKG